MKLQNLKFCFLLCVLTTLVADDVQLETKIPLGLAHDGTILWVADAAKRELTGYDVAQKKTIAPRSLSFDVRDIAYWAPNLVTVAPNYVYVFNPLNGDLVDKIQLKGIDDPVAIALDMHQAYIYNRSDKKIHRVQLADRLQFGAFTPDVSADIRSMTFYKGYLWAVAKDGKAYKLSPSDGSQASFLPLPDASYGIAFVDGGMYIARPGQVRSIDFIETDSYVAAAKRNFTLAAEIDLVFPWSKEAREREPKMRLAYSLLPLTAHQRIAGLRAEPFVRFGRNDDGAHTSEIILERNSQEQSRKQKIHFQATLYNLTHIFNAAQMKLYFKNPELSDNLRIYLDKIPLAAGEQSASEKFQSVWLAKNEGKHPVYAISALWRDETMSATARCATLRALGVPCRRMHFYDLDAGKMLHYLQVYLQPVGWVSISTKYDATRPKEFPVANNELELYSPDDLQFSPKEKRAPGASALPELMRLGNVRVITSSLE